MGVHLMLVVLASLSVPGKAAPVGLCSVAPDPHHQGSLVNCSGRGFHAIPFALPLNTTTLLLARNELTTVPNFSFHHLLQLQELDLSGNLIDTLQPQAFHRLINLTELDLSGNLIDTLQPQAFHRLINLIDLSLYNNCLVLSPQTYPPDLFKTLESLKTLNLSRNFPYPPNLTEAESGRAITNGMAGLGAPHPVKKCLRPPRKDLTLPSRKRLQKSDTLHTRHGKTGQLASLTETFNIHGDQVQAVDFDYPGEALSHLTSLCHLSIDGVANKSFGPGFQKLTKLTHLDLNGNIGRCQMVTLDDKTFHNLPNITHLDLTQCNIFRLTQDAFKDILNLETLDLSFNVEIGFGQLSSAFHGLSYTKLTNLTIDLISHSRSLGTTITSSHLRFFKNLRHLQQLQARFNRIEGVEEGALCQSMPPNLKHINVGGNLWELAPYVNDLECLKNLEQLKVDGMDVYWTPPLKPPNKNPAPSVSIPIRQPVNKQKSTAKLASAQTACPSLTMADEVQYECPVQLFHVPPRLESFSSRNVGLNYKLHNLGVTVQNNLQRIDLSQNYIPEWRGRLCGFHNITELYLMNTFAEHVSNTFFYAFHSLQVLNISSNSLRSVFQSDKKGQIFQGLKNLRVLDISRNNLGHFPNNTLLPLKNLEKLVLVVNGMGTFSLALSHMNKLQHLDISQNQLHTVPKETRDHLDKLAERMNVFVNMAFNPISCVCSNIDFLRWIRESKVYFGTEQNYFCLQSDGTTKEIKNLKGTIAKLEAQCSSYVGIFVGASSACIICITVLLMALAYRFRWKLRYLYYASRLSLQHRRQQQQQEEFHFDAFVSFSSEDRDFVEGELKQELEDSQGLRLCIHTRDFTPGQYIASNIVRSVQRSRRTLVVLSRALLSSDWCHYELQMALMEGVHNGRDVLIFLLYENVPAEELSREMLANLQATVYIEFPHTETDKHLFWARLAQALRE